jgi:hypothetical protein
VLADVGAQKTVSMVAVTRTGLNEVWPAVAS